MSKKPTKRAKPDQPYQQDDLDDEVRNLMSELCSAINVSLKSSSRINAALEKLSEKQYESALYLDAMVMLNPKDSDAQLPRALPPSRVKTLNLKLDSDDEHLLKSLQITVKPDAIV